MISKFWTSSVGCTELVSAIRNQDGHDSHSRIRNVSHIFLLITFTLDPPSMIVSGTSLPLMITITAGLLVSTTVGPSLGFVKNMGVVAGFGGDSANFKLSANRGTNCNSRPKGNMNWYCLSACHNGFSLVILVVSSSYLAYSCISLIGLLYPFRSFFVDCFLRFPFIRLSF